jgi:hypothetical protein
MNTKAVYAACLFAALNICTLSANAEAQIKPEKYTYDTMLDVQKVLSAVEDSSAECGVVTAHLTYLDSEGQKQVLEYRKVAENCSTGG